VINVGNDYMNQIGESIDNTLNSKNSVLLLMDESQNTYDDILLQSHPTIAHGTIYAQVCNCQKFSQWYRCPTTILLFSAFHY